MRYWHDGRWTEQVGDGGTAQRRCAYADAVKRIGKWSMDRMPAV